MKHFTLKRLIIFLSAGILLAAVAAVYFFSARLTEADIRQRVSGELSQDFQAVVAAERERSLAILKEGPMQADIHSDSRAIRIVADSTSRAMRWSSAQFAPPPSKLPELCALPDGSTYRNGTRTWYLMRHPWRNAHLLTLIPLEVRYNIVNANLPPLIFLGRYESAALRDNWFQGFTLHLRPMRETIEVRDAKGGFVFSVQAADPQVFTHTHRMRALIAGGIAAIFLLIALWMALAPLGAGWQAFIFCSTLVGLRLMMLWIGLPDSYVPLKLFSPAVLAIDALSPSLGDLLLNLTVILVVVLTGLRPLLSSWTPPRQPAFAWIYFSGIAALVSLCTLVFFRTFDSMIQNSKIKFEFSNVFELDRYSMAGFLAAGLLVVILLLTSARLVHTQLPFMKQNRMVKTGLGLLVGLAVILPFDGLAAGGFFALWLFTVLLLHRTAEVPLLRLDLLNFLLVCLQCSLLTTLPVIRGELHRDRAEMDLIANRLGDDHNLITESLYERVVKEVQDEAFMLESRFGSDSLRGDIGQALRETYFDPSFKGYEVKLFVYDSAWHRIDRNTEVEPYLSPESEISVADVGESTLAPNLYLVAYFQNIFENIYVGKFDLLWRNVLHVQVELYPSEVQPNRLYPQLLLDDKVRNKSAISSRFEYAIYRNGRLFRKNSQSPFPLFFPMQATLREAVTNDDGVQQLVKSITPQKTIMVRVPSYTFLKTGNLFSFVFYFYVLAFLLVLIPWWSWRLIQEGRSFFRFTLRGRIQVFLLFISVLPLFTVLFLLSPYIRRHIYQDLSIQLQENTTRVANYILNDYLEMRKPGIMYPAMQRLLRHKLNELEKTIFNDINVFRSNGTLFFTTQPAIYEEGLTGEYMDPVVYEKLTSGEASDLVTEDRIGEVSFFSGYYPLLTREGKIAGFLNIPALKNQEEVNAQSLSLLTFLVDLYVFLFLAIGIVAVIVSDSITRPLGLLVGKLKATSLGGANEPIQWNSHDEIGDIIGAYNQMLEKLAESEEKLTREERQLAWREMAKQVAHEIKNPLTPMKLSVQHLVRAWREDAPNKEKVFEKVTNTILVQIDSLTTIANSFSEFARMPEPQKSHFNLVEVIQEVAELYMHNHEKVQIDLHLPATEFIVNSDREQLSRVFNNLIKNGIQAIEHGQGRISIEMEVGAGRCHISVADNGKGISDEIKGKIFEPNFSTKTSGMGLGLAIVKRILESAGGSINFESKQGEGTIFHIELPAAAPQEEGPLVG